MWPTPFDERMRLCCPADRSRVPVEAVRTMSGLPAGLRKLLIIRIIWREKLPSTFGDGCDQSCYMRLQQT